MKVVSGCYVIEGYGATESTAAAGMQIPGDISCGNVGPPFLCSMYKLADVPEMDLVAARDNKGEVNLIMLGLVRNIILSSCDLKKDMCGRS